MGDANLTLHVDEYKAGGALYMTSKPSLGDTSYFRFNTAPGDGTISPDGFPHLVLGVVTMGEKDNGAEEAGLDTSPGTNFERMLREQVRDAWPDLPRPTMLARSRARLAVAPSRCGHTRP